ncbi:MAG: hypothetical protein IJ551_04595 [Prevotella sp.]|nr:hypothetical protein [Prevotella sp.]
MKKLSFYLSLMAAMMLSAGVVSCGDDDDDPIVNPTPEPEPEPEPVAYDTIYPVHYDLTVTVGKHGGMASQETHLTLSVASLADPNTTVSFEGNGIEITDYTIESIYDKQYMYQVPTTEDRFAKLQIKDSKVNVIRERPFQQNTYASRKYTHAWLNDNTLLIMAANGTTDKIIWTKLNTDDMTILGEGELGISVTEGYDIFTTSGLLTYRKADNKLFYFYYCKKGSGRTATKEANFHVAVINPETMAVEQNNLSPMAAEMQGSAYGELMQNFMFFDDNDNLYLSVFSSVDKTNIGQLVRIKKGEYNFEDGYNAFPDAKGKIVSVLYLGSGKALAYSGDAAEGTGIQDPAYYYSIVDLSAKTATPIKYNGAELPYSAGSFSQRAVYNAKENKAYFGVSNADGETVYIYDVATGNVTKGLSIAPGYYFDQIRLVQDDPVIVEKK